MSELNFETVDAEIDALDLDQLEMNMKVRIANESENIRAAIPNFCAIWGTIGKIVKLILKIPLKPKWRKALKLLIETMDSICG